MKFSAFLSYLLSMLAVFAAGVAFDAHFERSALALLTVSIAAGFSAMMAMRHS